MRFVFFVALGALAAWLCAAGCRSAPETTEVNQVVMARWDSLTDPESRRLIACSFAAAPLESEDYRAGPDDLLAISIYEWELREEMRTLEVRVAQSGTVALPVLGVVPAAHRTPGEIQRHIEHLLQVKGILREPRVTVAVKEFESKRISVVGAVREPGVYRLRRNVTTLLDVLSLAGGPDERAGEAAYVLRTSEAAARRPRPAGLAPDAETGAEAARPAPACPAPLERITVDLYELLDLGNLALNMVLVDGDVVHVPEAGNFYVFGYVREPGGFRLKRPTTVLDAVALARGLREREASPEDCLLKRRLAGGETAIPLNLLAIARGEAPNLFLQAGDILEVRQTAGKSFLLGIWDGITSVFSIGLGTRPL